MQELGLVAEFCEHFLKIATAIGVFIAAVKWFQSVLAEKKAKRDSVCVWPVGGPDAIPNWDT